MKRNLNHLALLTLCGCISTHTSFAVMSGANNTNIFNNALPALVDKTLEYDQHYVDTAVHAWSLEVTGYTDEDCADLTEEDMEAFLPVINVDKTAALKDITITENCGLKAELKDEGSLQLLNGKEFILHFERTGEDEQVNTLAAMECITNIIGPNVIATEGVESQILSSSYLAGCLYYSEPDSFEPESYIDED